ncbi:unnamed protein product [Mytilus coruscus]|uniref:Integrase catalytic domain-containing protein n=1 Tax=Mytilus coruscus TaxID=42192 RepID=A0A6J8CFP9_MYTCO|nr:unnamed protein product [Mytilus coruscus]
MKLDNETSKNTIDYLKGLMSRFGYIDELVSDNGPQFSSLEFKRFATEYGFKHTTSSPHYAQSNGQAERSVQTIKKLIMKSKDPHKALLDYRNTPLDIDLSPAQLFLNRRLKTSLPTSLPLLMPQNINNREIIKKLEIRQRKAKTNYDKHCGPELKQLKQGDSVVMYTDGKWKAGKIIQKHHTPRSYVVQTSDGRRYRRNRRHIRPTAYNDNTVEKEHFKNNHNTTVRKTSTVCNTSHTLDRSETVASEENENIEPSKSPVTRSGRTVKVPTKLNDYLK